MNKKQNIDQLFQDKLRDVEVTPRDTVWKAIDADLKAKNKKPFFII
jgi:aspartate oxidase